MTHRKCWLGLMAATLAAAMPAGATDLSGDYTWRSVMVGGGGWGALVFESPAAPGVVYFKDDCSSIYRLDPGAAAWKKLNTWGGLPPGYAVRGGGGPTLACAADDPDRVYMAWDRNLFYSDDRGDSWNLGSHAPDIGYMNAMENPQPQRGCDALRRLQRLVVDPASKDVAYCGTTFEGLYRTVDGGRTWSKLAKGLPTGGAIDEKAITGGFINTAFDTTGGTVGGRTRIVWAACRAVGVFRSADGGESFQPVAGRKQPVYYTSAACDAAGTYYVAAGSGTDNDGGIYTCARDGAALEDVTPFPCGVWQSVDIHPSDQRLWAQTDGFAHAFSADGGKTWTKTLGGRWAAGTQDVGWHAAHHNTTGMVRFSPATPDKLWIAYGNVAVSRNDPERFLVGQCTFDWHWYGAQGMSTNRYLKLTTDGGQSFADSRGSGTIHMWGGQLWGGNAMNLCADPNVDDRFVAFSNYDFHIYASTDRGASFAPVNASRPFAVENGVWAKIFGLPGQPGHFYFCQGAGPTTKAPLWKSTDGGATWASVNGDLTAVIMAGWGKAIAGADYPALYVYGTYKGAKGFFRSTDAGVRWDRIAGQYLPDNYVFSNVKDIDGDKTTEGKLYAILGGNSLVYGIWNQPPDPP